EETVRRALAKASAERFQTAEEFRHALHTRTGIVIAETTMALTVASAEPDAVAVRESRESRTTTVLPSRRGPSGRWMPAISAAGAMALIGSVAWSHVALAPTLTSHAVHVDAPAADPT